MSRRFSLYIVKNFFQSNFIHFPLSSVYTSVGSFKPSAPLFVLPMREVASPLSFRQALLFHGGFLYAGAVASAAQYAECLTCWFSFDSSIVCDAFSVFKYSFKPFSCTRVHSRFLPALPNFQRVPVADSIFRYSFGFTLRFGWRTGPIEPDVL